MNVTDEDVVRLARSCSAVSSHLLSPSNYETLIGYIRDRSNSATPSQSVFEYVSSLLSVVSTCSSSSELSSLLSGVVLCYIELFISRKIPHDRNSLNTVSLFAMYLSGIAEDDLVVLTDLIVGDLPRVTDEEDTQLMDLLPQCLYLVRNSKGIEKCKEYVDSVIDKILVMEWSKVLLVKMVSIVKEFSFLDKARHWEFLDKVFQGMSAVDLQDLPSLVYQLLVLASKGFSKRDVVERIAMFFGTMSRRKPNSVLRQVEGTVLLHVNFAVKQDPSMGQEIIGLVKSDIRAVNHFTVAVLFSVARIRRFTASSLTNLKNAVLTVYRDYNISKNCKWLPDDLKKEFFGRLKLVEKAMLKAVNESRYGREHIVPSIVILCFTLLETVDEGSQKTADGVIGLEELCIQMLNTLFEVHDMARNEVIDQCKFRILSLKPDKSMPILRLLGFLVKSYSYQLLEHCSRLKDLLDYFTYMHGDVASNLITILLPLIKISRELQDYIILVVRKAMFRREDAIRLAATNAIFDLILADKASAKNSLYSFQESSSQASCSQQGKPPCSLGANLFQELSGLLQRCLYQQAKVKEVLYYGLVKLVSVDPSITGSIFDFLLPHFLQFHNEHSTNGQLDLSRCVKLESGRVSIQEPLDHLLSCISWISLLQPHDNPGRPLASSWAAIGFSLSQENEVARSFSDEKFSTSMLKIRREIRDGRYEGILGSTQTASSRSPEAEKSICYASIVSGIVEVFLNSITAELEKATGAGQEDLIKELVDLINIRSSLERSISISTKENVVKKGNTQSNADHVSDDIDLGHPKLTDGKTFLATTSIRQLMLIIMKLYESTRTLSSQNQSQSSLVNDSAGCSAQMSYVLHACARQIEVFQTVRTDDPHRTLLCGDIRILGAPLLTLVMLLISENKLDSEDNKNKGKGNKLSGDLKEHIYLAFKCLKELIVISTSNMDQISMLEDMIEVPKIDYTDIMDSSWGDECRKATEITNEAIRLKELFMARVLKPLLTQLLSSALFREVEVICEIMTIIGKELPSEQRSIHGAWAVRMLNSNSIKSPKVAKGLVALAIFLNLSPYDLVLAQELAVELSNVIGFEDQSPREISEVFPIINHSTSTLVAASMLHMIESVVTDIDWATMKLKIFSSVSQKRTCIDEQDEVHAPILVLEETLFSRAEAVVRVLSSFVVMNLNDTQAEQLLRLAGKFYKQLARMSKLHIAPKGCKQLIPSPKFQNLVDATCKQLTVPLYNFVTVMQKRQEASTTKYRINKIKRENRCIPDLIFQIEDYEKYLIQLSKVSKVNFLRYAKRSVVRDFQIKPLEETAVDETVPNHGSTDQQSSPPAQIEMSNLCEDDQGDQDRVLSPETGSPMMAEDSDADNEITPPSAKRIRTHGVVQDSEEE
ncbi:unnamed protein product [Rhodiola kirilowii]